MSDCVRLFQGFNLIIIRHGACRTLKVFIKAVQVIQEMFVRVAVWVALLHELKGLRYVERGAWDNGGLVVRRDKKEGGQDGATS